MKRINRDLYVGFGERINTATFKRIKFKKIILYIKNGRYKTIVDKIRVASSKEEKNSRKKNNLPYFTFAIFKDNHRCNDNFISTRFMIFDIDGITRRKQNSVKEYYRKSKKAFCCFTSPGGKGLKIVLKLSKKITDAREYEVVYNNLSKKISSKFQVEVDATKDLARTCFLSYDPEIIYYPNCGKYKVENINTKSINRVEDKGYDISYLPEVVKFITGKTINHKEWIRIGFSLASLGEEGRQYFVALTINNPEYNDNERVANKKYDNILKSFDNKRTTINSLFRFAEDNGFEFKKYRINKFWTNDDEKIIIKDVEYLKFLEERGFGKIEMQGKYCFVKRNKNRVKLIDTLIIKEFVLDYLDKSENLRVKEKMLNRNTHYFDVKMFESLKTENYKFHRDTKEMSFVYFKNCYVEITKEGYKEMNYDELKNNVIWEKQIIDKTYTGKHDYSDFGKFVSNVCNGDKQKISALKSCIGYLTHTYKNPSFTKAIIFYDENLDDGAKGRRGKSLIGTALEKIRNVAKEDGKNFNASNRFLYQKVNVDTQIIVFDDVTKKFSFEKLFHSITDGLEIEKKNKDAFTIPFSSAPKFLITTNTVVKGEDDSSKDRKYEFEFSNHYNPGHTPIMDFGKIFFEEWNEEEWDSFYYFMVKCIQHYLKNGLVVYKNSTLKLKKLIEATSRDFANFIKKINKTREHKVSYIYTKYVEKYLNADYTFKQNSFTKYLNEYADIYYYKIKRRYSSGEQYIRFIKE